MRLEVMIEQDGICTLRPGSNELRDTLPGHDRASLEMHLEAEIKWTQRHTWRPWSSEFRDVLRGLDQMNSEIHSEAVIERIWWCTCRPKSSELRDAVGGHDRVTMEVHLAAVIIRVWRCTWRLLSSEIGGVLLEVVDLEAVDGRCTGCWDSIHRLVNSKLWECDKVTLPLKLFWRTGLWRWICTEVRWKLKLRSGVNLNHENEGTTENLRCMLYSEYAALGINSWSWHGQIQWDDLTLCSCEDGRVVDKEGRDGGWR